MNTGACLWTRPQGNREKREKFGLRAKKSEKSTLSRPQGKTRKPAITGLSGHEKGGQRKSVPPHMVELAGIEPASTSHFRTVLHV